jgi:hypothetical protein
MERCFLFRGPSGVLERFRLAWPLVKKLSSRPLERWRDRDRDLFVDTVETESESELRCGRSGVGDRGPSDGTTSLDRLALTSASC